MAYQEDFRNKVIAALKRKNLAVDLSEEQTQEAIIQETQIVAQNESNPITPEEMRAIIQDVARQVAAENRVFTAQSNNFVAFSNPVLEGPLTETEGSYSGGGIAVSVANKDIVIIPSNGGLGAAGTATSVNSISQIDFKHIANPNAYGTFDPNEVKASLFNWAERIVGTTFDTPVLGIGGAWGGVSYAPTPQWGVGNSRGSGIGGSINQLSGFGQIIFFKPATSTIYSSLFNDVAISTDFTNRFISIIGYQSALPGVFPTAGFAISFGGIGGSGALAISGAASASQLNRVRFLSPLTITNSTVTDTLTLGLSSASNTSATQNFVGGGNAQYTLSTTTSSFTAGDIFYSSSTGHTHLIPLNKGSSNSYLSVNGSGNYQWTTTISASTANVAAASGTTVLYPIMNNSTTSGSALSYDINFNVDPFANVLRYESGSFYVGTAVSSPLFISSGDVTIRPGANSVTAIQLDNVAGTPVLNVDTSNSRIGINNVTAPNYTLDVAGDINAATGKSYRIDGTLVLNAGGLGTGVTNSSLTSVGTIATGTWAATAITTLYGGIGNLTTFAVGDLLYANSTTTIAKLAAGTAGSVLTSTGLGSTPNYSSPALLSVGTAVTANNVNLAAVGTTTQTHYITISRSTTGTGVGLSSDSNLTWVSATTTLNATILTGTAVTVTSLTGTIITASQPNITSASTLATVGTITTGRWQSTTASIGTTYGGTGSNLGGAIGNSNKVVITGTIANGYAATLIDGANTGYLLAAQGNASAPSFVNTTNAAFSFASGSLTINNAVISTGTITGTPTNGNDIVNKTYADSISAGLDIHDSARLTTNAAIGGSYRQSGTAGTLSGFGDYIISTTPGTWIGSETNFDNSGGTALTFGHRVLVKDGVLGGYASGSGVYGAYPTTYGGFASSWVANGIYEVSSIGGAATSGWLLVRATDSDNRDGFQELTGGTFLFVEEGPNFADHAFVCSNDTALRGSIGFGSTQIAWTLFAGGNTLIAGQGLVESGNNLALLVNLVQANQIAGVNLSRGFTLGGTRAASLGSSTLNTFTVTADSDARISTNTFTALADGYTLSGGVSPARTLTVTGSSITLTGGGNTLTLGSSSNLSLNSQTLTLSGSSGNLTFTGSANNATTFNLYTSGTAQYALSTSTNTWGPGDMYYVSAGIAHTALARLIFAGAGNSVLIKGANAPVWGTINLASTDFVSGILPVTNGGTGANTFTSKGILFGNGNSVIQATGNAANSILVTDASNNPSLATDIPSNVTIGGVNIYRVSGTDVSLADGGTNASLTQTPGAIVYGTNSSSMAFNTAGNANQVLLSGGANAPTWGALSLSTAASITGTLPISNGGTGSAAAQFTSNGVVIYDSTNTRLISASGVTAGSTGVYGAGFFIAGNSVVTNVGGIYGAVTFSSSASVGGSSFLSASSQNLVINYPGTGITGGGAANRVAYYNAAQEITSNSNFTFSPTAATGVGLSISVGTGLSTVLYVNNTNGSATAGFLVDVDQNGAQRFSIDFKGMTSISVGAGNTALSMTGGRTVFATSTANYASLNIPSGVNMSAVGSTQIGDLWFNGTNLYFRKDATTNQDLLVGSVSGSGIDGRIAKWSSGSGLTYSNLSESTAGVGMTLTSLATITSTTSLLTLQTLSTDDTKTDRYFIRGVSGAGGTRYFSIDTSGNLRATTKSFDIPHPTKEGMRLVYGVLEGPEHGVYHRGTAEGNGIIQVNLPDYWHKLVGDQYTIQLTPWGNYNVGISSKTENYFTIQLVGDFISRKFKKIKVDYLVHGSRLDAPLDTEQ